LNLDHLNAEQQHAVVTHDGPVLVLAGAGTGKTTVITWRIAGMLEAGVKPDNILAVTFTNKAAREMRERLEKMLPSADTEMLTVSTFHSFCCRMLRRHMKKLGGDTSFGIADDGDQDGIIRQIMGEMKIEKSDAINAGYFRRGISDAKNRMQLPEDVLEQSPKHLFELIGQVYKRYQQQLHNMNLVDFDDLLLKSVLLWRQHPDVLNDYRERFTHILVDEYQDTNMVQAELMRLLANPRNNICVVGDDDQSIYGWRGADISNILDFPDNFPGGTIIKLEENYRSTNTILEAANHVIARNTKRHGKALWSRREDGELLKVIETEDETAEAATVVEMMKQRRYDRQVQFGDMAILFRSNHQTRIFEQVLMQHRIPYRLVGSKSFYERREIKDAAAYFRLLQNPRDDLALLRVLNVPPRGIGDTSIARIRDRKGSSSKPLLEILRNPVLQTELPNKAAESIRQFLHAYDESKAALKGPGQMTNKLHGYLQRIGYLSGLGKIYKNRGEAEGRMENIREFLASVSLFESRRAKPITLLDFLEAFALTDDSDRVDDKTDDDQDGGVTLMTVHAAKGLEFPFVALVGMEQGLFPHERSLRDYQVDEERRLFYVALTRAKTFILMTRARMRTRFSGRSAMRPSQFLSELPPDIVEYIGADEIAKPAEEEEVHDHIAALLDRFS
jgi:superfamily I DNA/RNA helicase